MTLVDLIRYRPRSVRQWLTDRLLGMEHAFEHAKASRREDDARLRILLVLGVFVVAFSLMAVGAANKALFSDEGQSVSASALPAARADLVDRNGRLLAVDLVHYSVSIDPRQTWDAAQTRAALLAALPQLPPERLDRALKAGRRVYLAGGLTPEEKDRVHDLGLPELTFAPEERRLYPQGPVAAHLIGFTDTAGVGLAGAERALGSVVRRDGEGQTVALSIDLRVQAALEDELQKEVASRQALGGVGLITDVHTGEILGMASAPDFDPNNPQVASTDARYDRAAAARYEMGSIFKVFTLSMGIDSGVATPSTVFNTGEPLKIGERVITDYHALNRPMTLTEVFLHSSNIGAAELGLKAGRDLLTRYFKAFGLFDAAPVELAESARPLLPRLWNDNAIASASFGHAIAVSPLAVAAGMGAVLNGGLYVPLTIRKLEPGQAPRGRRVIKPSTARQMLELMRLNVEDGTGGYADAPGLRVGGKTGTAEKAINGQYARERLVSDFAAVFPADGPLEAPRYFVFILLDEPKIGENGGRPTGGATAAPVAGRVIDRIAPFLGVERVPTSPEETQRRKAAAAAVAAEGAL